MNFQNQIADDDAKRLAAASAVERDAMMQTDDGRAILFVKDVLSRVAQVNQQIPQLRMSPIAEDTMVGFTLALLAARKPMKGNIFKDTQVKIAYHYTKEKNLRSIGSHGFTDPNSAYHRQKHGNVFGNGIYVGGNPYAFDKYGECCVLVAVLTGQASRLHVGGNNNLIAGLDTMIGNKLDPTLPAPGDGKPFEYYDEIVLRNSSQVVPLIWFWRNDLQRLSNNDESIWRWHTALQQLVDTYINDGRATTVHMCTRETDQHPTVVVTGFPFPPQAPSPPHRTPSSWSVPWTGPTTLPPNPHHQPTTTWSIPWTGPTTPVPAASIASPQVGFAFGAPHPAAAGPTITQGGFTFGNNSSPATAGMATASFGHQSAPATANAFTFGSNTVMVPSGVHHFNPTPPPPSLPPASNAPSAGGAPGVAAPTMVPSGGFTFASNSSSVTAGVAAPQPTTPFSFGNSSSSAAAGTTAPTSASASPAPALKTGKQPTSLQRAVAMHRRSIGGPPPPNATQGAGFALGKSPAFSFGNLNPPTAQTPHNASHGFGGSSSFSFGSPTPSSIQQQQNGFGNPTVAPAQPVKRVAEETLEYRAPNSITSAISRDSFHCVTDAAALKEDCTICLDPLGKGRAMQIKSCKHAFHADCIEAALNATNKCPICRKPVGEPQGTCPSGTLAIKNLDGRTCSGYEAYSTIELTYTLYGGTQMPYHDNPGQSYRATRRVAYLPNNQEGQDLLKRLKYAWEHGLTFVIGTSMTTGRPNSIVWGSIHHKTSMRGGMSMHGFPDAGYFVNANEELDALFVPKARDL